jgi:1-acyl-sn-glycerol-3-phosphate acyltransferase
MLYNIGKIFFTLLFKILCRLAVFGVDNIPREGGFILASNHISYLDPIVLGVACSRELNFMAKEELFKHHFFGWLLSRLNVFPLKRGSADLRAIKEALRRLKNAQPLLLFPEGGRQNGTILGPPQAGVGFLAAKLNLPVIPAFIRGTEIALPQGAKFIRPHKISVYFGKRIIVERRLAYQDIAFKIMEAISHLSCSRLN